MINIVLPIAGRGSRFANAGYHLPKPLIPVHGIPMIHLVVNNIRPSCEHRFIFVVLQDHLRDFSLEEVLREVAPDSVIIPITHVTQGAACTVLLARAFIESDDPLMIANSDQWVDVDINDYIRSMNHRGADGMIMTMKASDPKWSFAALDKDGWVIRIAEKVPISDEATVGIYNFKRGKDFLRAAEVMIQKDLRVNNEFYVAPCYNELLSGGRKIAVYNVGAERRGMYGLGIPEDLEWFSQSVYSAVALERCVNKR